jgi:hypothetical protein
LIRCVADAVSIYVLPLIVTPIVPVTFKVPIIHAIIVGLNNGVKETVVVCDVLV